MTKGVAGGSNDVPRGIVTFLFSDVESSTRLWAEDHAAMSLSLEVHDDLLRGAFESRGGYVFTTAGDSFAVAFSRASDAVAAAGAAQARLAEVTWPGPALRVRMGLHLGEAQERGGDYFGSVVNLAARLEAAGHGGQVLLTDPVRQAGGVVATDLGTHELRDVAEPVQVWQLGEDRFPALRVVDPELTNLPVAATGLVGRADDVRRVREGLAASRLVTLTAAGGTGKTRLAMAVGEEELPHRPDGVWFVDLTSVSDGGLVGSAVAAGLGLRLLGGDPFAQIVDYLANKELLLIVDNCEHLVDECAELAERFLARRGASVMLATSRQRLDLDGERVVVLPPLATDDEASAAVELFATRAGELDSSFALSAEDRSVVAQLCRRLDGMPLAIELAAARSAVMSTAELLAGIEDRFALLGGGHRRRRKRTLEATLDWSYELLDADEQAVLRSLGVFVGGFDLDAVAAVSAVPRPLAVNLVDSLIAKSLVVRDQRGSKSRFRLFETTAAYARRRLSEADEQAVAHDRHLDHYLQVAQRHSLAMWSDLAARTQLGADKDNIVAALEWAAEQDRWQDAARLLLGAFAVFYSHPVDGAELVDRCLEHLPAGEEDLAMRLTSNQWLLFIMVSDISRLMETTRRLRDSALPLAQCYGYGNLAIQFGNADAAKGERILSRAIDIQRRLPPGPDSTQAAAANHHKAALLAMFGGHYDRALEHARAAIGLHDELGFVSEAVAHSWAMEALCSLILGEPEAALGPANRYNDAGPLLGTGDEIIALVQVALGDLDEARRAARTCARNGVSGRVVLQASDSLLVLAVLAHAEGDTATASNILLNMGVCRHGGLVAYSRHFAARLGVSAEFEAAQAPLLTYAGDAVRRRAAADIETLHREMLRRQWM